MPDMRKRNHENKFILIIFFTIILIGTPAKAERVTQSSATLMWNANREPDIHHYIVEESINNSVYTFTTTDTISHISIDATLSFPFYTTHTFDVRAVDFSGNISLPSDSISTIMSPIRSMPGDVDQDGRVRNSDILRMYGALGKNVGDIGYIDVADLDGDGRIRNNDILAAYGNLGHSL